MGTTGLVAVLFTDLVGSSDLVARLSEERAEELRQAHFALLREAIAHHSGTEVKNLGDGLMVAFGAASDAVGSAVAMQQAVERGNRRGGEALRMRVGVAVGEATCEESDYFGTPVIEASRLCARADGGGILVTDMVRALTGSRGGHRFEPLGPVELKGLPDPVSVHEVLWEPLAGAGLPLPARLAVDESVVFVGRAGEREVLEQAWKRAEHGTRQVVLLAGEPGIGKTRLATEIALAAHHQGGVVLLGTCDEDLAVPYEPFVEALGHLAAACPEQELAEDLGERGGELARLLPELPRRVPGLPPPQAADPETERYLLFSAVAGLLATTSRRAPVLLLLEDLHWATKPTLLMLKHLVHFAGPMSLLVIGTYRDSEIGRGHPLAELLADLRRESGVERLSLRGLSDDESVAFMEALAGHDLKGDVLGLAHAIYEEADGSPFFMRELLRHLAESGEVTREGGRWIYRGELSALEIPDSVREVIGRRLSRLPEPVDRLLTLAAVIGREFDVAVLARLADMPRPAVVEALEEARRAALVREVTDAPGRFTFVHALIRDDLYQELGTSRRMELHRAVAETFETLAGERKDAYLAELAYHWLAATPAVGVAAADTAKAAGYAEQAGRRAMASLAYEEAVHHFEGALRAVRLADDDPQRRCDLLIDLGEAQRAAGDPAHRETLLEAGRLAQELGDAERAARAALANQRGMFSRIGAIDHERVAALEAALDAVGPAPTPVRARLLASLATELHFAGDQRRVELGQQALAMARGIGDPATLAEVLAAVWLVTWGPGTLAERSELAAELAGLARQLGDRTLEFRAGVAVFYTASEQGDMERADEGLAAAAGVAEELGQPVLLWRATYLRTHRAMASGRFAEVARLSDESLRRGEVAGQPDALAYSQASLAIVRLLEARPEEAAGLWALLDEQFPGAVVYRAGLAWACAEEGRAEEARAILADLRTGAFAGIPPDYLRLITLSVVSRTCCRLGDAAAAEELYGLLLPHRSAMVTAQTVWLGPVAHDLGLLTTTLGRYEEAEEHFAHAAGVQERIGARGTLVHTQLEWARMLLRRGQPEDAGRARTLLETALAGAQEVGLPEIERRIAGLLAEV